MQKYRLATSLDQMWRQLNDQTPALVLDKVLVRVRIRLLFQTCNQVHDQILDQDDCDYLPPRKQNP